MLFCKTLVRSTPIAPNPHLPEKRYGGTCAMLTEDKKRKLSTRFLKVAFNEWQCLEYRFAKCAPRNSLLFIPVPCIVHWMRVIRNTDGLTPYDNIKLRQARVELSLDYLDVRPRSQSLSRACAIVREMVLCS